jgi:hypothetical protein
MADIKIIGVDKNKTTNDGIRWMLYFQFSENPSSGWISHFNDVKLKNNSVGFNSADIQPSERLVIVQAPAKLTAQQLLDAMNVIVEQCNRAQDSATTQLDNLKF